MTRNEKMMSIIVPVYNVEKWLEECIESILNQSYQNIEVILINDGSTDKSGDICRFYESRDSRIRLLEQQNQGLSISRNHGIETSQGEYIMFVDSDDFLCDTDIVEKFVNILNRETCDFIYTTYCRFNDNNSDYITEVLPLYIEDSYIENHTAIEVFNELLKTHSYHHAAYLKICRRDFLINHHLYFKEGIYHEDADWTPKLFYYASKISVYKDQYYMRRMRENSIITSMNPEINLKKLVDRMKIAQDLVDFFKSIEEQEVKEIIINDFIRMYWGDLVSLMNLKEITKEEKVPVIQNTYDILSFSKKLKHRVMYQGVKLLGIKTFLTLIDLKGAL